MPQAAHSRASALTAARTEVRHFLEHTYARRARSLVSGLPLPNLNWLPHLFLSIALPWTGLRACWIAGTPQQGLGM